MNWIVSSMPFYVNTIVHLVSGYLNIALYWCKAETEAPRVVVFKLGSVYCCFVCILQSVEGIKKKKKKGYSSEMLRGLQKGRHFYGANRADFHGGYCKKFHGSFWKISCKESFLITQNKCLASQRPTHMSGLLTRSILSQENHRTWRF